MNAHGHQTRVITQKPGTLGIKRSLHLDSEPVDIIVGQRIVLPEMLPIWRRMLPYGRLVMECDDDLLHVDERNIQAAFLYQRPAVRDTLRHSTALADLVTVSTEPLKQAMVEDCDLDPDKIVVLPNCVDTELFDVMRKRNERLTIGWAGGGSHDRDMEQIHLPLRRILDRNPHVDLHLIGHDFRPLIRRKNVHYTRWSGSIDAYWRSIDFDIALAPLAPTIFNQSKSALRFLEMSALGVPTVASDSAPYRSVMTDGETGFLAHSDWQWVKHLQQLIDDAELRESMGKAACEHVRAHYSIADRWPAWPAAYERVLKGRLCESA